MTARLILARHGNTFGPDQTPVWVGARSDVPLVDKGLAQARDLAEALRKTPIFPDLILSGPLQRTRQTAEIVTATLGIAANHIRIDPRLTEIDYGKWEGKSLTEIEAMGGANELAAWEKHSIFPVSPGWSPTEMQIAANVQTLLSQVNTGTSLIVTSNGILRFFARPAANKDTLPGLKVATGYICVMERDEKGVWHILHWNQPPTILYAKD